MYTSLPTWFLGLSLAAGATNATSSAAAAAASTATVGSCTGTARLLNLSTAAGSIFFCTGRICRCCIGLPNTHHIINFLDQHH